MMRALNRLLISGCTLLVAGLAMPFLAKAQTGSMNDPLNAPPVAAETRQAGRIVLVPYKPNELLSDAETDLAEANHLDRSQVRDVIRLSMDASMFHQCQKHGPTVRLMVDSVKDGMNDLEAFYNSLSFHYVEPARKQAQAQRSLFAKLAAGQSDDMASLAPNRTPAQGSDLSHGRLQTPDPTKRVYAATATNTNLFPYMAEKFQADYFLVVTQMEIKTRYQYCLDLANKNYEREFTVHYTLFDRAGTAMQSDFVTLFYPSANNAIDRVVKDNFGIIASTIANRLPE
jgi:hypothetical protein